MKLIRIITILFLSVSMVACSSTSEAQTKVEEKTEKKEKKKEEVKDKTAEEILKELQEKNENVTDILVYDEETDTNDLLGRPGEYTSKADFSDARIQEFYTTEEEKIEYGLSGGTIEVFKSKKHCDARADYLKSFMTADTLVKLDQYMYKYDKVLFRVSYSIVPSEAEVYKKQMDEIIGQKGKAIEPEE